MRKTYFFPRPCIFIFLLGLTINGLCQVASYEEHNPNFEVQKVEVPCGYKYKSIIGKMADGRLLLRCSPVKKQGEKIKQTLFWIKKTKGQTVEITEVDAANIPIREMTAFDKNKLFFTKKVQNKYFYYLAQLDTLGNFVDPQRILEKWPHEIKQPFIFRLGINDEAKLIFSCDVNDDGNYDLYISENKDGWKRPSRITHPAINTEYAEGHPFVSKDGLLFFSSNRPQTKDTKLHADLWMAKPGLQDFNTSKSVNPLPGPFSSSANEVDLITWGDGLDQGVFISNRAAKQQELYTFTNTRKDQEVPPSFRALIIAIDDYEHLPKLEKPISNGRELGHLLRYQYGFEVDYLDNPDKATILQKLSQFRGLQENDYLLLAFFGHGILPSQQNESCTLAGVDGLADGSQCIYPIEYIQALSLINRPKHILTILDACYSGLFFTETRGEFHQKSRMLMASTQANLVPDGGPFFRSLISHLKEHAQQSQAIISSGQLNRKIEDDLETAATLQDNKNRPSYRSLIGEQKGDFPFLPIDH